MKANTWITMYLTKDNVLQLPPGEHDIMFDTIQFSIRIRNRKSGQEEARPIKDGNDFKKLEKIYEASRSRDSIGRKMTEDNLKAIPSGLSGIYAIYHDINNVIDTAYVGRAKGTTGSCIKTRLQKHFNGKDKQRIGMVISTDSEGFFFSYQFIEDYEKVKKIEKREIVKILPPGNVQKNFRDSEIEDLGIE